MICGYCPALVEINSEDGYENYCALGFPGDDKYGNGEWSGCSRKKESIQKKLNKLSEHRAKESEMLANAYLTDTKFPSNSLIRLKLIQRIEHMIGLDYKTPRKWKNKKYYTAYRNYWYGEDSVLDMAETCGIVSKDGIQYHLTEFGFNWIGNILKIRIKYSED